MSNLPDPIDVQFGLIHDCIRSCIFADYIARKTEKKDIWLSLMDMCYADAVMSWNSIFGTNSQQAHWKKFVDSLPVPDKSKLKPFSSDLIQEDLKVSSEDWSKYHREMVDARNNWIAHFNLDVAMKPFPNVSWALRSCYVYRQWLLALLGECRLKVTTTTNAEMKMLFEKQIAEACI